MTSQTKAAEGNQDSPDLESSLPGGHFRRPVGNGDFPTMGASFPALVRPVFGPEKLRQGSLEGWRGRARPPKGRGPEGGEVAPLAQTHFV